MNKTVTISVDGVSQQVSTLSGSVDGALDAAGLTVAEHDTLAPAADSEITDGSQIVLRARPAADPDRSTGRPSRSGPRRRPWKPRWPSSARIRRRSSCPPTGPATIPLDGLTVTADTLHAVTVTVDGAAQPLTSAAKTVGDLLDRGRHRRRRRPAGLARRWTPPLTDGATVSIVTLPTVTLADGANPATSSVTEAATVGDVLAAAGVTLGADDTVSPPVDDRGHRRAADRRDPDLLRDDDREPAGRPAGRSDPERQFAGGRHARRSCSRASRASSR